MRLLLLGAPGAGKGTQGSRLSNFFHVPRIATGDILREARKAGTELGTKAQSYMDQGLLVPDDVVIGLVQERLQQPDCRSGYLLDGFPRTVAQAEALNDILTIMQMPLDAAVLLDVPEDVILQRLTSRYTCTSCQKVYPGMDELVQSRCGVCGGHVERRSDDEPETVAKRLEVYAHQTAPLVNFYRNLGKLVEVNGLGDVQEVEERILSAIGQTR